MSKLFSPDDLRRNGYTRYPRQFLSILIKDYCKDKKSSVKTGIMLYLYSKASYSGYSYMWNGEQYAIKEGQCIVKIPEMAAFLNCSVYALRKNLNDLAEKKVITKKKFTCGLVVEIINYTNLFIDRHE